MNAPQAQSRLGCVLSLLGAACGAIAVGWWRSGEAWDQRAQSLLDQTPSAVGWLAFWTWLGATVGFIAVAVVAKCIPLRQQRG